MLLSRPWSSSQQCKGRKNLGNEDEHCFLNPLAEGKVAGNDCCGLGNVLGRNGAFARLALYLWAAFGMGVLLWTLCCFVSCPQAQCLPLPKYPLHWKIQSCQYNVFLSCGNPSRKSCSASGVSSFPSAASNAVLVWVCARRNSVPPACSPLVG